MSVKNIKIGKRLGLGFGILGLLMITLVITGIVATKIMNSRLEQITLVNNAKIQAAYDMKDGIKSVNLFILSKLVSKDEAFQGKADQTIHEARAKYKNSVDALEKLEASSKGKELIGSFKENIARGKEGNAKALEAAKAGDELTTIVKTVEDLHSMVQQIASAIEEMSATSDEISKDIESISGISNETSMSSGEVTKASQELARLGTDLQCISKQFEL